MTRLVNSEEVMVAIGTTKAVMLSDIVGISRLRLVAALAAVVRAALAAGVTMTAEAVDRVAAVPSALCTTDDAEVCGFLFREIHIRAKLSHLRVTRVLVGTSVIVFVAPPVTTVVDAALDG